MSPAHGLIIICQYSCTRDLSTSPRRLSCAPLDLERAWTIATTIFGIKTHNLTVITDVKTDGPWQKASHLHVLDTADIAQIVPAISQFRKRAAGKNLFLHFSGHGICDVKRGTLKHGIVFSAEAGAKERILWEDDLLWLLTGHGNNRTALTFEGVRLNQSKREAVAIRYPLTLPSIPPPQCLVCIMDCCYAGGMFKLAGSYNGNKQIMTLHHDILPFPIICLCAAASNLEAQATPQGSLFTCRIAERLPPLKGKLNIERIYDKVYRNPTALLAFRHPVLMTSFHKAKTLKFD